jgi:hypothetical protein
MTPKSAQRFSDQIMRQKRVMTRTIVMLSETVTPKTREA